MKQREGKGREGKGNKGKGRQGKARQEKAREGKGREGERNKEKRKIKNYLEVRILWKTKKRKKMYDALLLFQQNEMQVRLTGIQHATQKFFATFFSSHFHL